jgi:general L-amino acid transport system substrate-binding protein
MSLTRVILVACILLGFAGLAGAPAQAADPTLAAVKKRGQLLCGINGQLPGFSAMNEQKEWAGFEIEFCRAIAAAVLRDATKVKFVPLTASARFDALRSGEIDVLARNSAVSLERTAKTGVRDAVVIYIDGQAVVVPKKLGITALTQLGGHSVCSLNNTPYVDSLEDWFDYRKLGFKPVMFNTQKEMYEAFYAGQCDALTQDISAITTTIVTSGKASEYMVLPDIIARHPLAAYVRAGDDEWFDVVRWTFSALLEAEERGVTQANVDSQLRTGTHETKRLLGAPGGEGKLLGLDDDWAFNVIKQVGNYSEIYERNLGQYSPLKFPRAINALWSNGGVLHPLPLR